MSKKTHKMLDTLSKTKDQIVQKAIDGQLLVPLVDRLPNLSPEHAEALYAMGYDFFHGKKYKEAESIFYFVCNLNHLEKKYWKALAITFFLEKKYSPAQAAYFTAFLLDPTDIEMMSAMADCAIAMGQVTDADNLLAATVEMAQAYQKRLDLGERAQALLEMLRHRAPESMENIASETKSESLNEEVL